ncbi:MAG: CapA family protein, partial [Pseudomonadota bacterium]
VFNHSLKRHVNDIPAAEDLVRELADDHDLVIVSFHGGAEGTAALHVPFAEEFYYGEARGDLVAFSHAVIDAGADLVIGHGPHVPRGLEIYEDRLIAYSLGNFATYSGISVAGIKGVAPLLVVEVSPDGRFRQGEIVSLRQVRPNGPRSDANSRALTLMRELSETDFGANAPIFTAEGIIFPNTPRAE